MSGLFGETRQEEMLRQFKEFHLDNPHFWELFTHYAHEMSRARKHYSARTVIERIRWHVDVSTTDDELKINNNHTPYYARLFHVANPRKAGFFRLRRLNSEDRMATGETTHIDGPPGNEDWLNDELGKLL